MMDTTSNDTRASESSVDAKIGTVSIEELEYNVMKANEDRDKWKSLRKRGLVPRDDNKMNALIGALMKADDELAHAKFGQRVKEEWARIDSVVEFELERIAGLDRGEITQHDQCAVCNEDLSNSLVLFMKYGQSKTFNSMCCGKKICFNCHDEAISGRKAFQKDLKKRIKTLEKKGGAMAIQDPGDLPCVICNCIPPKSDKVRLKKVKQFAEAGIPWAMADLSMAFAEGKYGSKKNPGQSKKWLLKSADANSSQSLYHLGECYLWGGTSPFGTFDKSPEDALKHYLAAADEGHVGAFTRLAQMHRQDLFVAACPQKAFEYASLAARQRSPLGGMNYFELFFVYAKDLKGCDDRSFDLATYWAGQAASAGGSDSSYGQFFSDLIAMYAAEDHWYKQCRMYPGFSSLPLAKLLQRKYSVESTGPFIKHWSTCCGNLECENRDGLQKCSQCGVFHYCSRACQTKHWKMGHKRDCNGKNHWVLEFFPDLRL